MNTKANRYNSKQNEQILLSWGILQEENPHFSASNQGENSIENRKQEKGRAL
jgi:hypothetical protein